MNAGSELTVNLTRLVGGRQLGAGLSKAVAIKMLVTPGADKRKLYTGNSSGNCMRLRYGAYGLLKLGAKLRLVL